MSERHECFEYREECPHCQPAILDACGRRLGDEVPAVRALHSAWKRVPIEVKRRYFQFTVQNIHSEENFEAMREIQRYWNEEMTKEVS